MGVIEGLADDLAIASLALARRFHAGATLWCWSPEPAHLAHHARHVAVEFVHPVIVGKRALPAVAVDDPDPATRLRVLAAPPDVLLAIGGSGQPVAQSLLRRAGAWGVTTLWLGVGARPDPGGADHVLWLEEAAGCSGYDGSLVRLYHVLWELTHVCFEHPGLLDRPPIEEGSRVCVTCADEAHLGEIDRLTDPVTAIARTAGGVEDVDTTLVGPVQRGDLVLIHAGTAIERVD